ncbi:uracil-DNA glycosylase [Burkholderia sp. WAC0059]|uniref:uracil-DNA glycosylase n=1 Tax=Burkholderia sp. WAC0059 TaxID=2066022 RepID=UPI000C7E9979|nr:uracil-DNA glycosylase [Burkholderia sp. WAC0059]PLZ02105.1 uracil-DNA glycosylase [Burkholderia sp. WAC0059]
MSLDEIALAELGLMPRWVSRGRAPAAQKTGESSSSLAVAGRDDDVSDGAREDALSEPAAFDATVASARAPSTPSVARPEAGTRPPAAPNAANPSGPDDDFAWLDDPAAAPEDRAQPADAAAPIAADASRNAVATLGWEELGERVAACQQCRLCERRTNTVFGVGDREAEWMLVGEAPGENEDRLGEPFVGQAGKLLDNMLHALSLARGKNVYIANVIKCRPPGNRNPEPDEVMRCEPYLQRQVALVQPKIIVALGRFAAQSLLKTDGSIASLRGRVHRYEGVPVIVTYHPAYLLRSLNDKSKAWTDLCLARDTWRSAGGGEG